VRALTRGLRKLDNTNLGTNVVPQSERFVDSICLSEYIRKGNHMSGGGGGGDTWRPEPSPVTSKGEDISNGGSGRPSGPCDLVEITTLNSPNRGVISTLRAGDRLEVKLESGPPQRLLAKLSTGETAGSITSPSMLQIVRCIVDGHHQYEAEVLSIRGAVCQVQIQPK
jgi:hypothetical protein